MKAFVTGGTGFIGRHVVRKLLERGYDVAALARSDSSAGILRAAGARVVRGDIGDKASMRAGMAGADVVFHVAGWYEVGDSDWMKAEQVNVGGTRNVLTLAVELEIPRILYVSTVAVFGDTKGQLLDENDEPTGQFRTEYERTKWLAHYKVAVPLIEEGAPIIIAMPGGAYGPGDHSFLGQTMEMFYRGSIVVPGPETTFTYAHVEDIAEGIILAAEKGELGESYILAGPAVPLGEMVDFWSYLTGKPAPPLRVPASVFHKIAPAMEVVGSVAPLPRLFTGEALGAAGVTYMARADKARAALGWRPRPLQAGMLETFEWIAANTPPPMLDTRQRRIAGITLLAAAALLIAWLLSRDD
jgi:nucleoside-diphosphate-sugar epimerase